MVDQAKRNTLIMLGGTAVVTAMPALASSVTTLNGSTEINEQAMESLIPISRPGSELSIALQVDEKSSLTITNNTDKLVIIRHVHPGIVHTGEKTFDINSVFERSAYAIGAGRSRTMPINETISTQAEVNFPRNTKQPLRVASLAAHSSLGQVANSSRSFYA